MSRYFTRAEAEALLPLVEPKLREIQRLRAELTALEERQVEVRARVFGNGHQPPGESQALDQEMARVTEEIGALIVELAELGIEVKDLETGLIDFLALRDDHPIYLCWRLGESRIAWWHEIEAGFAGRQPLTDEP